MRESVEGLAEGVAHDFNNLLAVILNFSSFVLEDLAQDNPCRADVVEIRRAAEKARDLTHQLLVFAREPDQSTPVAPPGGGAGTLVLVVDDQASVRTLTVRTLSAHGYGVIEARDGHEGLERCRQAGGSLDLLLTDLVMPGLSGVELGARAREENPGLPVVYMSGYGSGVMPPGTPAVGEVLPKPFDRETLLRALEDALAERRAIA